MKRGLITFSDLEIQNRLYKSKHTLFKIEKIIDWASINKILSKTDHRLHNKSGRDNYSPLMMFKIMLIQRYYDLSDRQIETELMYNLAYIKFCGLSIEHPIPDHSTIARWRQRFIGFNIYEELLENFNLQLTNMGYNITKGVIVDATLVESYARPRKKTEIEIEPTGDAECKEQELSNIDNPTHVHQVRSTTSKDPDACWIKKGKKSVYGYKYHAAVNLDGLFLSGLTTPANVFDGNMFEYLMDKIVNSKVFKENKKRQHPLYLRVPVLCDKGYDSAKNRNYLIENLLIDKIMYKKPKKKDFSEDQQSRNIEISKTRYKIERSFGLLKRKFKNHRTKYIGQIKTHNYNLLGSLAHNFLRCLTL